MGFRIPTAVSVGDAVIVSADRGEDLGVVTHIVPVQDYLFNRFHGAFVPEFDVAQHCGRVLRLATPREIRNLSMKTHDESEVLKVFML